jgi:hypothetical protein
MTGRRAFLVAILIYVAVDAASPDVPGAFVFDLDDSVESVGGREYFTGIVVEPLPLPRDFVPAQRASREPAGLVSSARYERRPPDRRVVSWLPHAVCALPPGSEDTH